MITTIITTYRRPLLLKRAVDSVLKQTHPHFQVCVYDNASDDETETIMQEFIKKDSRVKYHRHAENIGMMSNYQYAFSKIDTPYFSLLSDDDFLLPHFYETALQGFQKFPDVAFSACGIAQIDESGNLVGDPLASWKSEGFYAPVEALFEMLKMPWKFPIPTGVLFQNKFVKNIQPDFGKDLELFWDPDHLIKIAARYPIVINKKHCGFYLAHQSNFSNSFYINLLNDVTDIDKYLKSTHTILESIKKNPNLNPKNKKRTTILFIKCVEKEFSCFIKRRIKDNKLNESNIISNKFYLKFGKSSIVLLYHILSIVLKYSKIKTGKFITLKKYLKKPT